jgi:hypothetical protein
MATTPTLAEASKQSKNVLRIGVVGLGEIAQAC